MTREEAIDELKNAAWLGTDHSRARTEEAVDMAIKALEQEPCDDEITLKVKRGSLKIRQGDMVIYNVAWLREHWQMEMDIVCGVKPCDDAISRDACLIEGTPELNEYHYCPNCGAEMVEPQEGEEQTE